MIEHLTTGILFFIGIYFTIIFMHNIVTKTGRKLRDSQLDD